MQWTQTSKTKPRCVEIEFWPNQLQGNKKAYCHADDAPKYGHDGELPHNPVIEDFGVISDCIGSAHLLPLNKHC